MTGDSSPGGELPAEYGYQITVRGSPLRRSRSHSRSSSVAHARLGSGSPAESTGPDASDTGSRSRGSEPNVSHRRSAPGLQVTVGLRTRLRPAPSTVEVDREALRRDVVGRFVASDSNVITVDHRSPLAVGMGVPGVDQRPRRFPSVDVERRPPEGGPRREASVGARWSTHEGLSSHLCSCPEGLGLDGPSRSAAFVRIRVQVLPKVDHTVAQYRGDDTREDEYLPQVSLVDGATVGVGRLRLLDSRLG